MSLTVDEIPDLPEPVPEPAPKPKAKRRKT